VKGDTFKYVCICRAFIRVKGKSPEMYPFKDGKDLEDLGSSYVCQTGNTEMIKKNIPKYPLKDAQDVENFQPFKRIKNVHH